MAETKKNLKELVKFLHHLIEQEGNEWFHDEIAMLVAKKIILERDSDIKVAGVMIKEIGSIDKYIETGIIPLIDFSDIKDASVKYSLERDSIEMGKCRFSHFGRNESFEEFCKFAFFQIEQLINYYLINRNDGDYNKVYSYFETYNKKATLKPGQKVSAIPFSIKLFSLHNEKVISKELKNVLQNLSYIRNKKLHRSTEETRSIQELYPIFKSTISKNIKDKKDWEIINEYYLEKFIHDRDYNLITESILQFKNSIITKL